jgi:serine/threonine protein kinase/Tol biopolymer transport system component
MLDAERWSKVDKIFHEVLKRKPDERGIFLDRECAGDSRLRKEIETLIRAHGDAGSFMETPLPRMSMQVGTQLGSLELTAFLGKGGMGEVYRARDAKLKRDVAVKILPPEFSRDPDRAARFQHEAEVLASVNHPNIAAIYDVQESAGSRFLVLELVEGETLAERIRRGPIQLDEALHIAKSICEALEAAHEKGIVHRDLKPANVKIAPDGTVKVLDFGLAKAFSSEAARSDPSESPTLSAVATMQGTILGTAAYMSPEQARSKTADKRADIWAFGVVLYEMLTGRMLFSGENVSETLAAVMMKEPDWTVLPKNTPLRIREVLQRCLVKEPRNRTRDIGDVRIAIEEANSESGVKASSTPHTPHRLVQIWIAVAMVAILVAIGTAIPAVRYFRESPPAPPPEMRTDIVTPPTDDPVSFALSPDGQHLVFVASGASGSQLWLRPLAATSAQPLAGTERARLPFWSPDGRSVGFFADGKLKRLDIGGGLPQALTNVSFGTGGAWSPEGVILFGPSSSRSPILRVPASGGQAVPVTTLSAPNSIYYQFPQFLPGGRSFVFFVSGEEGVRGIYLGSLDAKDTKRLTTADSTGFYMAPGWLLFVRQGTLVAQRFDLSRMEITGDSVAVADRLADSFVGVPAFSVAANGLVAYRAGTGNGRQLTWLDRSGKVLGTLGPPDFNVLADPTLSPDGSRVAVTRTVQGNPDVWLLDSTRMTRFTFDAGVDGFAVWSPDGTRIAFRSSREGKYRLYQKPSNGAGAEELIYDSQDGTLSSPSSWSADGRFLLLQGNTPKTSYDVWVLPLDGEKKPRAFLRTPFEERSAEFSPDGHWVAYRSNESGRYEVYVRPFPESGGQWQVSTAGGIAPRWRRDGKELYYIAPDARLMAVPISVKGATLEPGTPVPLFQTQIVGGGSYPNRPQYDVASDGRFLINSTIEAAATSPITLIQNWKPKQ